MYSMIRKISFFLFYHKAIILFKRFLIFISKLNKEIFSQAPLFSLKKKRRKRHKRLRRYPEQNKGMD